MSNNNKQAVILGALLHDIGKFVQRASGKPRQQDHEHWGLEWFDRHLAEKLTSVFCVDEKDTIRRAINSHHENCPFITMADAISAGMDRIQREKEEEGDPLTQRQIAVMTCVSLGEKQPVPRYHLLDKLGARGLNEIEPVEDKNTGVKEYSNLFNGFTDELPSIFSGDCRQENIINRIDSHLQKYTWCIPSAVYKSDPDVSLYDHLKTTAAIAGCLYDFSDAPGATAANFESLAFILVNGDISGIQPYIFEALHYQGKVAKRLRARSFYLQMIAEAAAQTIARRASMPMLNIVISAGGNFTILLPNTDKNRQHLDEMQKEFEEWCYLFSRGVININLAWVECSGRDLIDFGTTAEKLKLKLRKAKQQPYRTVLQQNGQWDEEKFKFDELVADDETLCPECRLRPKEENQEQCNYCKTDTELGGLLPRAKYIAFYQNPKDGYQVINSSFKLLDDIDIVGKSYCILSINEINAKTDGFKFIANHVPIEVDNEENTAPKTFADMADLSHGGKIAYLKGDADNMGEIFKAGFINANKKATISRYASLSRMLDLFFAGRLQRLLETDFNNIYAAYSGGDDFMVVGPWNEVIDFAMRLRDEFGKFSGGNPCFTFSAGILVAGDDDPVAFCARKVDEVLGESKSAKNKDSTALFGKVMKWNELVNLKTEAGAIMQWMEEGIIAKAFVMHLYQYGIMYDQYKKTGKARNLEFVSMLAEDIKRNLSKTTQAEARSWAFALLNGMSSGNDGTTFLPLLSAIAEYALTYTRR
jgi:CRISPR-associated protein Csm1